MSERFWRHVSKGAADECWLWTAAVVAKYGVFTTDDLLPSGRRRMAKAHRFSWELANGPIPDGLLVCHTCDVPLCVNPGHLFVGTYSDNKRDQGAKGRNPDLAGERNPNARINAEQAREIRGLAYTEPARVVGERYGIGVQTVYDIWLGRGWRSA